MLRNSRRVIPHPRDGRVEVTGGQHGPGPSVRARGEGRRHLLDHVVGAGVAPHGHVGVPAGAQRALQPFDTAAGGYQLVGVAVDEEYRRAQASPPVCRVEGATVSENTDILDNGTPFTIKVYNKGAIALN